MTHFLQNLDGNKGQLGNDFALKEIVQEAEDHEQDDGHDGPGFELEQGEVAAGFFEAGFDAVDFLGLGFLFGSRVGFHGLEFLGGFVDRGFEGFVGVSSVD